MPSALDPNRMATLEHRLDVRLAARRAERARRHEAAKEGWRTRRQHEAKHGAVSA